MSCGLHGRSKSIQITFDRLIQFNRDMNIGQALPFNNLCLVPDRLAGVERRQIDDGLVALNF